MCRRAEGPGFGKWFLPMGFLECGETLEAGAAREVFEETGAVVDPGRLNLYWVINLPAIEQIAITFRVEFTERPTLVRGSECLEVAFMAEDAMSPEQLAWGDSMAGPEKFFRELRSKKFTINHVTIGTNSGSGFRLREYQLSEEPRD
jgi:ADP-ribose pyrophosphatase YjhB (NUDIX family)